MSRFFSEKFAALTPYTPGEQPRERKYIKLNTNESPFPPSPKAIEAAAKAAANLQLYSDPTCKALAEKVAQRYGVSPNQMILVNGSDEVLNFAFMAFCDKDHPAAFPDITYGFYEVFAELHHIPYTKIPLREDFSVGIEDYIGIHKTVFIANPNAPTGMTISPAQVERILQSNPDNVIVIDEAYVDFGAESCVPLVQKYDNLLVTQTFSKSRSLAGGRLGFGIGAEALIADLHTIRYSTNPYNVNSMTMAAGYGVMCDEAYTQKNCQTVCENRAFVSDELKKLGFEMTESKANFIFARHPAVDGGALYAKLKEMGILVRHFEKPRIRDYNRITVGTREEMQALLDAVRQILEGNV
ncbi:MAG: histidinol-phosphate transaminase [Ruminococcaceae bacterium]|nr:histidinol-phosphate transaminase [Oscillospiraceae bacterium]